MRYRFGRYIHSSPSPSVPIVFPRYEPRHVRFEGIERRGGFRLKRYRILRSDCAENASLAADARVVVDAYLGVMAERGRNGAAGWWALPAYGVGTLIIHEGLDANFVLLDVWVDANMLRHHVWSSPRGTNEPLRSMRDTDLSVCVWELAVLQHERAAWLRHVLRTDESEDICGYLADTLETWL